MRFRTKAREKVGTKEQDRNQGQYKRAVRRHDGGQAKTVVKEEGREKGRFRMGVRNRKRSGQNEDRNEDSGGPREDNGKQHRFGGRGMAGSKRESLKVMGQDGVQESGGGPEGESTEVRGWESGQTWMRLEFSRQDMTGRGPETGLEFREQACEASGQKLG